MMRMVPWALLTTACMPATTMRRTESASCPAARDAIAAGVRWVAPADPSARESNADWCRATAALVLRQAARTVRPADTVHVLSWNVNAGGGELRRVLRERLALPCDGVHGPDRPVIVLLQEAFRAGDDFPARGRGRRAQRPAPEGDHRPGREDVVRVAEACGLGLFYVPAVRNGWGRGPGGSEDRGNAVLSSLAIERPAVIVLPLESARRVAAVAEIDGLQVATTHLTTLPLPWRMITTGNSSRIRQVSALIAGLDTLSGRVPTLLAGDFNAWSLAEGAMDLLREAFPDSPPALKDTRGPYPTDHVFLRGAAGGLAILPRSYRVVDDEYGSDHRPIVFDLVRRR